MGDARMMDHSQPYDPIYGWASAPFVKFMDPQIVQCPGCKTGALLVTGGKPCGVCEALRKVAA